MSQDKIRILLFDADGCMLTPKARLLLDRINEENKKFNQIKTGIISARNDLTHEVIGHFRRDLANETYYKLGLMFYEIQHITKYLKENLKITAPRINVTFDPFLNADMECNKKHGQSFENAVAILDYFGGEQKLMTNNAACERLLESIQKNHSKIPSYTFDETKFSLIYPRLHKYAQEFPDDDIQCDVYDDREDILFSLAYYFEKHKELIPKNVTLVLHKFDGEYLDQAKSIPLKFPIEIKGIGEINKDYKNFLTNMHNELNNFIKHNILNLEELKNYNPKHNFINNGVIHYALILENIADFEKKMVIFYNEIHGDINNKDHEMVVNLDMKLRSQKDIMMSNINNFSLENYDNQFKKYFEKLENKIKRNRDLLRDPKYLFENYQHFENLIDPNKICSIL